MKATLIVALVGLLGGAVAAVRAAVGAGRRVPLGARLLAAHPARSAAGAAGIGVAVMLILLLDGLWAGVRAQVTVFEDHTGAQLLVVSPGTGDAGCRDGAGLP